MKPMGRAFAIFRSRDPQLTVNLQLRSIERHQPLIELELKSPDDLCHDISLRTIAEAANISGMNMAIEAVMEGRTNLQAAMKLLELIGKLDSEEVHVLYMNRGQYHFLR